MIERRHQDLTYFQFASLAGQQGLAHGISSRHGGVSRPPFDTLNLSLSVGDDPEAVETNRARFAQALGVPHRETVSASQVHGAEVYAAEDAIPARLPRADILITNRPGRVLSQRFADCTPILLWDPRQRAIAAAHAGWRGTTLGVAQMAVIALAERYWSDPAEIRAAIGPSIGPCCYEVGPEVVAASSPDLDRIEPRGASTAIFDLWESNRRRLESVGVRAEHIEVARLCTRCLGTVFFSHRGSGGAAGRFGSLIALTG